MISDSRLTEGECGVWLIVFTCPWFQIPDLLRESVAFGKNVAATIESCVQVVSTVRECVAFYLVQFNWD